MNWLFRVMGEASQEERTANANVLKQEESWQIQSAEENQGAGV